MVNRFRISSTIYHDVNADDPLSDIAEEDSKFGPVNRQKRLIGAAT